MPASSQRTACAPCHEKKSRRYIGTGWWSGFVLAILPKCPFCFVALSGTAVLCGEGGVSTQRHVISSTPTILMCSVICLVVLISVLFNYNTRKTPKALLVLLPGIVAVVYSATWGGGEWLYYTGTAAMFLGIWMNGSFQYFSDRIRHWWRSSASGSVSTS